MVRLLKITSAALMMVLMASCSTLQTNINRGESRFVILEAISNGHTIVYDRHTRVMYDMECGLHPLFNADGSLLLYKGEE